LGAGGEGAAGEERENEGNPLQEILREPGIMTPGVPKPSTAVIAAAGSPSPVSRGLMRIIAPACVVCATLLALAGGAAAQQASEPPNPLPSIKALKCRFPAAASATWKNGEPAAQTKTQELVFEIVDIDVQDGTAEYRGTAGNVFVTAVLSGWSVYFVENAVGQLNVTTVFAQEAAPKRLKAVHSRHGYLQMQIGRFIAEPSVSQNYGDCEIG
jgi:hypothetical protein